MSTPSSAAGDDDGTASTSLVRIGDTIRANIEMLADRAKGNWKQNMEQFEQISFRSIAVPVFGEARLAKWDAGWERVKDIYRLELTMEWRILKMAFCTGFAPVLCMGYFFGGATTYQESLRRFEVYTAGKIYLDRPHNQLRSRRFYYSLIRFNTRGCRVGLKLAFGLVSIAALVVVPTTFRAHFSVLNFPLATMMVLGAHTTFRGWGIVGWHACVPPTIVVTAFPLVIILCYCLYHRCTPNEFYWRIKKHYEQQMRTDMEYRHELNAYAHARKKAKVYCLLPWARAEMEREREYGTWRWTSGVEDGLVHLEQEEKPAEEGEMAPGDDEMDEDKKILEALEQKRKKKAWWRIWRLGN